MLSSMAMGSLSNNHSKSIKSPGQSNLRAELDQINRFKSENIKKRKSGKTLGAKKKSVQF